ncbi:hypothetical protein ES705_18373 [subsurface metagenome]
MATVETIKEVVSFLAEVTGKQVTPALFALWEYSFEEVGDEDLKRAAFEYADMNRFFPTPMDLKVIMGEAPKTRGLAWARITGYLSEKIEYGELDDMSKKLLEIMGGPKYVKERMTFKDVKITFFQMYDDVAEGEYVEQVRERMMLSAPVLISGLLEAKDGD